MGTRGAGSCRPGGQPQEGRPFWRPCVLPDPGRQESLFSPLSQQEKQVFFIGVSKIASRTETFFCLPSGSENGCSQSGSQVAARLSAWHVAVEQGLEEQPGDRREGGPWSLPFTFVFLKVFLGSSQVAFPEGVREKLLLVSDWPNRMNLPSPFFSPKNNDRFPYENPL